MAGEFKYTQDPLKEPLFLFKLNWSFVFMRKKNEPSEKTTNIPHQTKVWWRAVFDLLTAAVYHQLVWGLLPLWAWEMNTKLFKSGLFFTSQPGRYLLQSIQLNWCSQLVLASQCGLGTRRYVLAPVVCYHRGLHLSMVLFWLFTLNCVIQEQRRKKSYYFILTVL